MSTERESDDIRRAREALAAPREPVRHDPAFRARLRHEFASGTLATGQEDASRGVGPGRIVPLPAVRRATRSPWLRSAAVAAAVVLAVVAGVALNTGPAWRVAAVSGTPTLTVDGRTVPTGDAAALSASLVPGAVVSVPEDGVLEILSPRTIAVRMQGGTEAIVPPVPGRWFGRTVRGSIRVGEWRISTGAGFHGARLAVSTPTAHVEVTGTTLAVICEPKGTCVCVHEGRVRVGRSAADMITVSSGHRRYVYADTSRSPLEDVMLPHERPALERFRETMRPLLH